MSAISEKVRNALYAKLNVSGVTSLVGFYDAPTNTKGKIFESLAPDDAATPYVIFGRQAPEPITYTMGPTQWQESDLWLIKAVTDEDSDKDKGPQKLAEDILAACVTALGTSLTLSGNEVVWFSRFSDMPPFQETLTDRTIYHRGMIWRIAVE